MGWERFGIVPSFRPFLVLAAQVSIDFVLICEIVRDRTVYLFQPEQSEILTDRLGDSPRRKAWTTESSEIRVPAT